MSYTPWVLMWTVALGLYFCAKSMTFFSTPRLRAPVGRVLGYWLGWPGMDARAFLAPARGAPRRPAFGDMAVASGNFVLGLILLEVVAPVIPASQVMLRGWVAMVGIVFVLHFGLFHVLSLFWKALGVDAKPVMNWPILSQSITEFWGRRWNTAFRDLTHRFLFQPLASHFGPSRALWLGFLVSGLLHEAVISLPANAGFGGPTAFFLVQACALFVQRSSLAARFHFERGLGGRAFTVCALIFPCPLLFHAPFLETVVVPFSEWLSGPWRPLRSLLLEVSGDWL